MPYSGAPRDKLIGALTDIELGKLCDFDACLGNNGYDRICYGVSTMASQFHLNTIPLVAGAMLTCYPTTYAGTQYSLPSREDCIALYRTYFATCQVAAWEDCSRESSSDPLGSGWAPDCDTAQKECPVN
jgi:hypothetical protein